MKKPRVARGGRQFTLYTSLASQLLALLRNVVVARIIGPEEFGIGAIIILTGVFLGSLTSTGPENLLVQAKDTEEKPLLAAAHAVTLMRGISTGLLILVAGGPLSEVFGLRLGWISIVGLAITLMVGGLHHYGIRVVQRDGQFRPEALSQVISDTTALAAAVIVALLTKSHVAVVAGVVARAVALVACAHVLSPQPYRLNWERSYLHRFWSFGWPLLINGPLMFLSAQADRLFILRGLGAEALGVYSAMVVLVTSPTSAIGKWLTTIYLPSMSQYYHKQENINNEGVVFEFTTLVIVTGWVIFVGFGTIGVFLASILYGSRYEIPISEVAIIGFLQVVRVMRAWPTGLSLAVGASGGILASTVLRLLSLPIAFVGLAVFGGLMGLLVGFVAGELIALTISLLIANSNGSRSLTSGVFAILVFATLAGAVVWAVGAVGPALLPQLALLVAATLVGSVLLLLAISPRETMRYAPRVQDLVVKRLQGFLR